MARYEILPLSSHRPVRQIVQVGSSACRPILFNLRLDEGKEILYCIRVALHSNLRILTNNLGCVILLFSFAGVETQPPYALNLYRYGLFVESD